MELAISFLAAYGASDTPSSAADEDEFDEDAEADDATDGEECLAEGTISGCAGERDSSPLSDEDDRSMSNNQ
jgi:hypothetical protein